MKYFLIREDKLSDVQRHSLEVDNVKSFNEKELMEMNCLARMECLKGNFKLNQKLLQMTEKYVNEEVKANYL